MIMILHVILCFLVFKVVNAVLKYSETGLAEFCEPAFRSVNENNQVKFP